MTNERYKELMGPNDISLTDEEIANNWHFCADFDFLLMQAERNFYNPVTQTCVCGYEFPKSIEEQTDDRHA